MYEQVISRRGITRLCHFTRSKNLPFILGNDEDSSKGIVANNFITDKSFLTKTDSKRLDNHEDYICTSVQYPNCFYFSTVLNRTNEEIFKDWVILQLSPKIIDCSTKFCPVNAATKNGQLISNGVEGFESLFVDEVQGRCTLNRSESMKDNSTTDIQAEVLIHKYIDKTDITGIIFPNLEIAKQECFRLKLCGIDLSQYDIICSHDLFEKETLITTIRDGGFPQEEILRDIK